MSDGNPVQAAILLELRLLRKIMTTLFFVVIGTYGYLMGWGQAGKWLSVIALLVGAISCFAESRELTRLYSILNRRGGFRL